MAYNTRTNLWTMVAADQGITLSARACTVMRIVFFPGAANQEFVLADKYGGKAIGLKAGASDASPVHLSFADEGGRKLPNLVLSQIDGGSADVYLIKEDF